MSVISTMSVTDAELAARRLEIVTNLLEKTKREKGALSEQIELLKTSNNELSQYASTFKLDEKQEAANIEAAKENTVVDSFDMSRLDELNAAEDFASASPDMMILDIE